jgi:hypothetical protein
MFCKICFDAKKPETDYKSHNIRMGEGRQRHIACPILKSIRCHYCNGKGHTTSYCKKRNGAPVSRRDERRDERRAKRQCRYMNPYAILNERPTPVVKSMVPTPITSTPTISHWNSSFADVVKTSLEEAKEEIKMLKQKIQELKEEPAPAPARTKMSWADMMEEEEELEILCC